MPGEVLPPLKKDQLNSKLDTKKVNELIDDLMYLCFECKTFPKSEWIYTTSGKLEQVLDIIKDQCIETGKKFVHNIFNKDISAVHKLAYALESSGELEDSTRSVIVTTGLEGAYEAFGGILRRGFAHDWDQGIEQQQIKGKPYLFINIICSDKITQEQLAYLGRSGFSIANFV